MMIRPEQAGDEAAIGAVTQAAFAGMPYSDESEPRIVERLREAGVLTLSLVAEDGGEIVGHIAFSPVVLSGGQAGWYGLGPVSVRPDRQGHGIGGALIREGLRLLREGHAAGCIVVGNPALYRKFGFVSQTTMVLPDVPAEYFLVQAFDGPVPAGSAAFHPGFFREL